MLMVLCTLFIHINIIPTRQKIHLIWTEYYSEHNVYVFALAGAWTPIAWVRVHHANHILPHLTTSYHILLAQWITWLTRDHCNPKVPSSIPAGGKDFPWARKFNHIALCLGGHIKVRVPGATIARKNTCVIITPQYYAPKWALLSINQNQNQNYTVLSV